MPGTDFDTASDYPGSQRSYRICHRDAIAKAPQPAEQERLGGIVIRKGDHHFISHPRYIEEAGTRSSASSGQAGPQRLVEPRYPDLDLAFGDQIDIVFDRAGR